MRISVYLPLAAPVLLALLSPLIAAQLPPRAAVRTLTASAVIVAAASLWAVALLALTLLFHAPPLAERMSGPAGTLSTLDPTPMGIAFGGAVALASALLGLALALRRSRRSALALRGFGERMDAGGGSLLVLDDEKAIALAVPGNGGHVLVSSGMLRALSGPERRVLLAHERSHLRHRHHLYRTVVALAAAVNPLLGRVREDLAFLLERWADEDAATAVQSRGLVASALTTAALAATGSGRSDGAVLAFERLGVLQRVVALQGPPPRPAAVVAVAGPVVAVLALLAAGDATLASERLVHLALANLHGALLP